MRGIQLTHREWHAKVKRLLQVSDVTPTIAARGFHRLAKAIQIDLKRGLHEWHLMQTYSMASLAEAAAGNHAASAATLARVVHHRSPRLNKGKTLEPFLRSSEKRKDRRREN